MEGRDICSDHVRVDQTEAEVTVAAMRELSRGDHQVSMASGSHLARTMGPRSVPARVIGPNDGRDGRQASVHRCSRQNEKDRVHGECSKYPEMTANEKRLCLFDGHRGGKGLWSTKVVLPATGDLVLKV